MRGEFIDVGGARLYYYAAGSRGAGEPLLLVHGFPTSSFLWSRVVPLVPRGHRVVVPDLFGFGRSDPAEGDSPSADLSLPGHAQRLTGLLDVLGIEKAAVIGHGVGATIALEMCASGGQRVSRLGLINPLTPLTHHGLDSLIQGRMIPMLRALPSGVLMGMLRRRLAKLYGDPATHGPTLDHYLRPFRGTRGAACLLAHMRALSVGVRAPSEGVRIHLATAVANRPIAIVYGTRDTLVPRSAGEQLRTQLVGSSLDGVAGGHFSPEESPEQVGEVLRTLVRAG